MDTDIGTDVDDLFALSLILHSPELTLEGVCCVYGDVEIRARMVHEIFRLRGVTDIPVRMGVRKPLLGLRPIFWMGHEGRVLLENAPVAPLDEEEHAADFIIRTVRANPGQITLVCIGPLMNIALALIKAPDIAQKVEKLVIMGGVLRGKTLLTTGYAEHNIVCDPEAAHIVFNAGWPITLVPLDVTEQVSVTREDARRLHELGDPFHIGIAKELDGFFAAITKRGERKDATFMHDPLTVACLIDPSLVRLTPVHVDIELRGTFATAATLMRVPSADHPANVNVALEVDALHFESLLRTRLMEAGGKAESVN